MQRSAAAGIVPGRVSAWSILSWLPFLGLAAWLVVAGARLGGALDEAVLAEIAVLAIPLIAAPLALPLSARRFRSDGTPLARQIRRFKIYALAGALGGVGLVVAALLPDLPARALAGLTAPWLLFCGLAAVHGVARLLTRSRLSLPELAIDVSLMLLPGAAVWLMVYRGEWILGGFGGLAAVLTAAHFHAAGFGTLLMTGMLGRGLAEAKLPRARKIHAVTTVALLLAFPLLAGGIATGIRGLELAGAGLYVVALPVLAMLQIAAAVHLRDRPAGLRVLLGLSAGCLMMATVFAGRFAMQGFYGAAVPIATMLRFHGLINALGFLGLGLLAWSHLRPEPLAGPAGIPFSRLRSSGRVGAGFFAAHAPTRAAAPAGLVDSLDVFDRTGFDSDRVDPAVREFYEETGRHTLAVTPSWRFPFRLVGRLWRAIGRSIGQLTLPPPTTGPQVMPGKIVAVEGEADGRAGVRGWVRQLGTGGPPVYVAAYATHRDPSGQVYMNIAFPLPWSNMTSVLRVDHDPERPGGLVLTSCSKGQDDIGDQGVYLATALGGIRLPLNETMWVWSEGEKVRARHRLWALGLPVLLLEYEVGRAEVQAEPEPRIQRSGPLHVTYE
jgi:hypothetical protein